MSQSLRYHAGQPNEDWIQRNESEPQAWVPPMHGELVDGGRFYYKSCNEQKIAMTGSWCQALPGSSRDLSCTLVSTLMRCRGKSGMT